MRDIPDTFSPVSLSAFFWSAAISAALVFFIGVPRRTKKTKAAEIAALQKPNFRDTR
jgi:hypothetical protein